MMVEEVFILTKGKPYSPILVSVRKVPRTLSLPDTKLLWIRSMYDIMLDSALKQFEASCDGIISVIQSVCPDSSVSKGAEDIKARVSAESVGTILSTLQERYGIETKEPMVLSDRLVRKIDTEMSEEPVVFTMSLPSHRSEDPPGFKRTYKFKIDPERVPADVMTYDLPSQVEGVKETTQIIVAPEAGDKFNFVDILTSGKVKFSPSVKINEFGKWASEGRQETKISKVIRNIIKPSSVRVYWETNSGQYAPIYRAEGNYHLSIIMGHDPYDEEYGVGVGDVGVEDLKRIVDKGIGRWYEICGEELKPKSFDIKVTDDVEKVYGTPNAANNVGTLGSSCMAHHNRERYPTAKLAGFYNTLSDFGVKAVYATDKRDRLIGRAVMWHDVIDAKDPSRRFSFIDRIYGSESFENAIKAWAYDHGYWHKVQQTFRDPSLRNKAGEVITDYYTEYMKIPSGKILTEAPYFDTMKYAVTSSRSKSYAKLRFLSFKPSSDSPVILQSTSGVHIVDRCDACGRLILSTKICSATVIEDDGDESDAKACERCSVVWEHHRYFLKSDKDAKLTIPSGDIYKVMPGHLVDERLLKINIDGKEVSFDAGDVTSVETFLERYRKKHAPKKKISSAATDEEGPLDPIF